MFQKIIRIVVRTQFWITSQKVQHHSTIQTVFQMLLILHQTEGPVNFYQNYRLRVNLQNFQTLFLPRP